MQIKKYNGKIILNFDDKTHRFSIGDKNIISVTGITSIMNKPALIFWAIGLMRDHLLWLIKDAIPIEESHIMKASKLHQEKKQEAADVGTKIHDWVELWIKGKKPTVPTESQVMNGVNAFLKWVKETKIKLRCSETIVYSKKHDYAGIMDAEGKMEKEEVIIDFKSSKAIYPEMFLQLSGYWLAREEETDKKYAKGYVVKFGKDTGDFEVTEISRKDHEKNIKAFLGALEIKKRLDELKCQ